MSIADLFEDAERRHCWVYLIHMEGTDYYKVGRAVDLDRRLAALQVGSPLLLYVLRRWSDEAPTGLLENRFHKHLRSRRLRGEWFTIPRADLVPTLEELTAIAVHHNNISRAAP